MSNLSDMPVVTTEQIVRFRAQALEIERQRDELLVELDELAANYESIVRDNYSGRSALSVFLSNIERARNIISKVKGTQP